MTNEDVNKENQTETPAPQAEETEQHAAPASEEQPVEAEDHSAEMEAHESEMQSHESEMQAHAEETSDTPAEEAPTMEASSEESAEAPADEAPADDAPSMEASAEETGEAASETSSDDANGEATDESAEVEGATAAPSNPRFKWYVVHTYSMYEEKAKQALLERIKQFACEEKFGQIVVPKTATDKVLKSGKKKRVEKTSFPGYMIVQMEMDEQTNHVVKDTPKVTGFVGNARNPRPITDQEVLRLTSPEQVQEQKQAQVSTLTFEKGENVKVTDGAFTNFDGIVEDVDTERLKLRILVSIFGRETPVELDYGQVQKLS